MNRAHKNESPAVTVQFVDQKIDTSILTPNGETQKSFATMAAQFAIAGHTLQKQHRADDGRVTYLVSRWGQSRTFSAWHDVQAFMTQIGGAK